MKKVSVPALILASFMLLTLIGPALAESAAAPAGSTETTAAPEDNLFGQVTEIGENTITIALAATSEPSVEPAATEQPAVDAAAPAAPALALTGETLTFTVTDSTTITLKGANGAEDTAGTMADITAGNVLTVVLTGNTAASITVEPAAPVADAAPAATEAPASNG